MQLFVQELKRTFKSFVFIGLAIGLALLTSGQMTRDSYRFEEPDPQKDNYGYYLTDDLNFIFPNMISDLYRSVESNRFYTYPYGFYREKNLSQDELKAIKEIVSKLLKSPYEAIDPSKPLSPPSEEELEKELDKIDAIIGGGSFYAKDEYKVHFGKKGMTYQDAMKDYRLMQEHGLDLAFARYFNDYAGIFILLFSWFMGLYFWNKDRKEGVASTIYVKDVSSLKIVIVRTLAMSLSILLMVLAIFSYHELNLYQLHGPALLNPIKAFALVTIWLFPTVLFVISVSGLVTVMTDSILLGFLGPIFSLVYMMSSSSNIFYNIGYGLLVRYNSIGNESYFIQHLKLFFAGRGLWTGISIGLAMITAICYERRRRGKHVL